MGHRLIFVVAAVAVVLAACGSASGPDGAVIGPDRATTTTSTVVIPEVPPLEGLVAETIATGLSEPVAVAAAPGIDDSLIVERTGRVVRLSSPNGPPALDLTDRIGWEMNEQGLLGFAVHPEFPTDPRGFAVFTNADHDVEVAAFTWTGSAFDPTSEELVLEVPQPHKYHQGGGIIFGPEGNLWMSFGDGGGIADRYENGQDPHTLNGTIVRIDVDHATPYAIPPDNPYVGSDEGAAEVWAFGLRNPWRFTFDGPWVVIADVGQYASEEVNVVPASRAGSNFGWPVMEADECFDGADCDPSGFTPPDLVVPHERSCAIIGGPVYRGTGIPELHGHYLYGDHCVGWIRSAPLVDGSLGPITDWERELGDLGMITSIDIDHTGEVVVANLGGDVLRIIADRSQA